MAPIWQTSRPRARSGANVATFLGSSQSDPTAEARALNGEFRLVYVTPEKLSNNPGFLDRLASMHQRGGTGKICLIAVDEVSDGCDYFVMCLVKGVLTFHS